MGGSMQPQGQVQIIINMVDFGMGIQAAGDAARWYHFTDTDLGTGEVNILEVLQAGENPEPGTGRLGLESGLGALKEGLADRGHQIVSLNGLYGGYQGILWDSQNKVFQGASEMRKDGQASGW